MPLRRAPSPNCDEPPPPPDTTSIAAKLDQLIAITTANQKLLQNMIAAKVTFETTAPPPPPLQQTTPSPIMTPSQNLIPTPPNTIQPLTSTPLAATTTSSSMKPNFVIVKPTGSVRDSIWSFPSKSFHGETKITLPIIPTLKLFASNNTKLFLIHQPTSPIQNIQGSGPINPYISNYLTSTIEFGWGRRDWRPPWCVVVTNPSKVERVKWNQPWRHVATTPNVNGRVEWRRPPWCLNTVLEDKDVFEQQGMMQPKRDDMSTRQANGLETSGLDEKQLQPKKRSARPDRMDL